MKILVFILGLFPLLAQAGEELTFTSRRAPETKVLRPQKANTLKVVPHLSANNQWKAVLTIRNDNINSIIIFLEFYNAVGSRVAPVFYDSDDVMWTQPTFSLELAGYEVYSMEFDRIMGGDPNFQIFLTSTDEDSNYSMEAIYNLFDGPDKVASVGVGIQTPSEFFIMGLDQRIDAYSGRQKFRGMAITNPFQSACDCNVRLYDDGTDGVNVDPGPYDLGVLRIQGSQKWLGTTYDLFSDIDTYLPKGIGYLEFNCTLPVSVLGLAFEQNTPIVASVPIDYLSLTKDKQVRSERKVSR